MRGPYLTKYLSSHPPSPRRHAADPTGKEGNTHMSRKPNKQRRSKDNATGRGQYAERGE